MPVNPRHGLLTTALCVAIAVSAHCAQQGPGQAQLPQLFKERPAAAFGRAWAVFQRAARQNDLRGVTEIIRTTATHAERYLCFDTLDAMTLAAAGAAHSSGNWETLAKLHLAADVKPRAIWAKSTGRPRESCPHNYRLLAAAEAYRKAGKLPESVRERVRGLLVEGAPKVPREWFERFPWWASLPVEHKEAICKVANAYYLGIYDGGQEGLKGATDLAADLLRGIFERDSYPANWDHTVWHLARALTLPGGQQSEQRGMYMPVRGQQMQFVPFPSLIGPDSEFIVNDMAVATAPSLTVALQAAQKSLMRVKETNHPFYWGGFAAVRGPQ